LMHRCEDLVKVDGISEEDRLLSHVIPRQLHLLGRTNVMVALKERESRDLD
jgi:hypothetical protein